VREIHFTRPTVTTSLPAMPPIPSKKRKGAPSLGLSSQSLKQARSIVDSLVMFMVYPKALGGTAVQYSDGSDARASNPQNTQEKPVPDWPQTGISYFPQGHPLYKTSTNGISGVITDPSGQPLQLTNLLFDEVTQARIMEDKNSQGRLAAYRILSDQGVADHYISTAASTTATAGVGLAVASTTTPIKPNCAVSDNTLWDLAVNNPNATASGFFNTTGATLSGTFDHWSPHGAILPVGMSKKDARGYIYQEGAAQVGSLTPTMAITTPTPSGSPTATAFITVANTASSFIAIYAGTEGFAVNDSLTVTVYGYNEGDQYILTSLTIKFAAAIVADVPIFFIPTRYSDYYGYDAGCVLATTTGGNQAKRSIRIGHMSFSGTMKHQMVPAVNSSAVLSMWSATRLLASSIYAENWTSSYSLGAKAGYYQPELGTHWQACGFDDGAITGGPYNFITSHFEEEDDTLKEGMYGFLQLGGEDRMQWRNNLQVASTLHGISTDHVIQVSFELDDRNFCMQTLVSPGVTGNQAAQAVELQFNAGWEGKTEQQILFRAFPQTDPEDWNLATKRTARMKHAHKGPDLAYFFQTEGWRRRGQARFA
jgi:hypothetical protein